MQKSFLLCGAPIHSDTLDEVFLTLARNVPDANRRMVKALLDLNQENLATESSSDDLLMTLERDVAPQPEMHFVRPQQYVERNFRPGEEPQLEVI